MKLVDKQKAAVIKAHGEPIGSVEVVLFADGHISLWQSINHSTPFDQVEATLHAARDHIDKLILDKGMCPFNPDFKEK